MTFKIALYHDKLSTTPILIAPTWDWIADFFTNFVEASPCTVAAGPAKCIGKECPYKSHSALPPDEDGRNPMAWSPTDIVGDRLDTNVRALTLLALDFDHIAIEDAQRVVVALSSWEHVLHTTHNHRDDDICIRAVLPLSRPVLAGEWHRFLRVAIEYLKVTIVTVDKKGNKHYQPDPTCKNRSRLYFRPSHPQDAPHDAKRVRGSVLDVDAVLLWASTNTTPEPAFNGVVRELPNESKWDLESDAVVGAIDAIDRYFPEKRRHPLALALGGMLRAKGATLEDARFIIHEGFRLGGSENPTARANTVDHTWALSEEAFMTGFTRVAEIIGQKEAEEIGDFLTDADNEAWTRSIKTATASANVSAVPPTPVVFDLGVIEKAISDLAAKKARSSDRDDKIMAVLLRRLLDKKPLAKLNGEGDVETIFDGATRGVRRDDAIVRVVGAIAFALAGTPWEAVAQVLRPSFAAMKMEVPRES